ncbi:MAG: exosortase/archaeosortase family protein [Anaerolineae bacterium]
MMRETTITEAQAVAEPGRPTYQLILLLASALFLLLPFITTFNEFLTVVVMRLGLDGVLQGWVVPTEVRMIAVILRLFGIEATVSETSLYLLKGSMTLPIYISWNCVGWQSFILFAITLITGLQGPYTRRSKVETVILGFLGTLLVNLLRISVVCVVAYYVGQLPAVIFHDYGGTILILLWLFAFWYFVHGYLLEPSEDAEGTLRPAA